MTSQDPQCGRSFDGKAESTDVRLHYSCDRCGATMIELQCKIICLNCGHRFDCSDLNIYLD